ncbi:uncharacterized protein LOC124890087 [Capsicum annuum]|uniref:uncharacterized protein LOC124885694 n=1 Tax=Capsicum annuum TaxID=4072 RepID=UPI001FB103A6|nr:uncharacterized protein LOC124885694 [Capsicum annuum]XP_047257913.1 uncharacterized protein LOC124890087 [Capsicum annuum]
MARKKQVDSFDEHTQTRTPTPRAAKADGMKTPVFKLIPTRQASFSKTKKGKQTTRIIFPQVHSKPDIHVEEVAVLKPESHVEKEAFISKKDFDAFHDEEQVVDIKADKPNVDEGGLEQSGQYFSPDVVQSSDNISDGTKQQHTDKDPDLQNMDYVGTERSPQRLNSEVDKKFEANFLGKTTIDEKIDETILSDSQFTIPDEMLPSLNAYQIQSIIIHPSANRQEESHHEILDAKTSETVIEDHDQMNRGITDSEVELATEEQKDEQLWPDSENTIPDEFLPSLNVYNQKSITIHPSANREVKTPKPKLRIRRPSKFKESPYTEKFGSAVGKEKWIITKGENQKFQRCILVLKTKTGSIRWNLWTDSHIDVCLYYLRKKSKYGPHSSYKNETNKSYKYSTVDCNFMNVIRSLNNVYSMDHQNLKDGVQEHHLIEYINGFRMHAAVPWHTVEDIFIPVNIKDKHHWVLAVLSFLERCIFLYDSYESNGHYAAVLAEIEKIAKIIPLDCGVFIVMYAECLSYGHKVIATEFDPNALRTRYVALLWDYGIQK